MFSSLPTPTPDPIFSLLEEAKRAGPEAINCTAGVLMDEDGTVSVLPSVQKAIQDVSRLLPEMRFSYPPLLGLPEFRESVESLLFPENRPITASIATTGGSGALAINLRLMADLLQTKKCILPTPAWANHRPPAAAAGLEIIDVPYIDEEGKATIEGIRSALESISGDCGILLQGGSHNPTGLDLTHDQWMTLIATIKKKNCIVLLDSAYQGLKDGVREDVAIIQQFIDASIPTLITWSASKNHTIYGLRTGLALAVLDDLILKKTVEGHYSRITRQLHSASATIGQMVVAQTQKCYNVSWEQDLEQARSMLTKKRSLLRTYLPKQFHPSLAGFGMFAMLPLSALQIDRLKKEQNVFMTTDGRINIAGIPLSRMEEFAEKVRGVS
jgi:aspartate/tyrosine/aromatic aminotransferase